MGATEVQKVNWLVGDQQVQVSGQVQSLIPSPRPLPPTPQHMWLEGGRRDPQMAPGDKWETRAKEMLQADPISLKWIF